MRQQLKAALESTSSHGLPRTVSNKPLFVRLSWLLLFLLMLALFLKGFSEFVGKLASNPPTSTLEANSQRFKFPDIYMCNESPVSASYAANVNKQVADAINDHMNATTPAIEAYVRHWKGQLTEQYFQPNMLFYVYALPYALMVDALAHRVEQTIISSNIIYRSSKQTAGHEEITPESFYHPSYLRCTKWTLNQATQEDILRSGFWAGIEVTLSIDSSATEVESKGWPIKTKIYANTSPLSVSEWTLSLRDYFEPDRSAAVRVFLAPPGEYPSEFVTSFTLGPGKKHIVDIEMTQHQYTAGQFPCTSDTRDKVQFVNPYDQTSYDFEYSYSYCFYHSYHKVIQQLYNMSGDLSPLPWPLRSKNYAFNLTGEPNIVTLMLNESDHVDVAERIAGIDENCQRQQPCTRLLYRASISSSDWPTHSSLAPFVNSSVRRAWTRAKARNLSVPALDFLMTGNASAVATYVRNNLLKVQIKTLTANCDKVVFSRDYKLANFVADIGGIMGIYLGMSLLTLCELLELLYDVIAVCRK